MSAERAAELDPDDLRPGTSLLDGRLVITQRIGRGGMSTVYAAIDEGRVVALKIIASGYATDPNVCQRFRNEARLAQALAGHPRVVTPYEVGEAPELGGRLFMTMPLIKGTPLSMMADRHAWRRWVAVVADLARTAADLHERGIIHRDIKPGNVILSSHGDEDVPHLLDFGAAYCTGDGQVPATAGLTRSDECPGTKFYMAPEQALGHPTAPSFDIYALALSLYELLAGVHPLQGMTPAEAVRRKCNRELLSLSVRDHRPDLPEALLDAVDRALERDPERRTPTAIALAEQLEATLHSRQTPVPLAVAEAGTCSAGGVGQEPETGAGKADDVVHADGEGVVPTLRSPVVLPALPASRSGKGPIVVVGLVAMVVLLAVAVALWPEPPRTSSQEQTTAPLAAVTDEDDALATDGVADPATAGEPLPASVVDSESSGSELEGEASSTGSDEADAVSEAPEQVVAEPRQGTPKQGKPKARRERNPSSAECVAARQTAERAASRDDWSAVLGATTHSKCWADQGQWRLLRVQTLYTLGRHRACVKAARNATDTRTRRTAQLCKAALTDDGSPSP